MPKEMLKLLAMVPVFSPIGYFFANLKALSNVPKFTNLINAKLPWKGGFLVTSFVFGQILSLGASIIFAHGIRSRHENLLKN